MLHVHLSVPLYVFWREGSSNDIFGGLFGGLFGGGSPFGGFHGGAGHRGGRQRQKGEDTVHQLK